MKCITSLVLFLIAPVGLAQGVPNTFTAGTPARAAEVNENFTDLDTRLTTGENVVSQLFAEFDFLYIENTSATGVVTSLCPVDTIGISANCQCDGDGTTSNFGGLFGCSIFPMELSARVMTMSAFLIRVCRARQYRQPLYASARFWSMGPSPRLLLRQALRQCRRYRRPLKRLRR